MSQESIPSPVTIPINVKIAEVGLLYTGMAVKKKICITFKEHAKSVRNYK